MGTWWAEWQGHTSHDTHRIFLKWFLTCPTSAPRSVAEDRLHGVPAFLELAMPAAEEGNRGDGAQHKEQ